MKKTWQEIKKLADQEFSFQKKKADEQLRHGFMAGEEWLDEITNLEAVAAYQRLVNAAGIVESSAISAKRVFDEIHKANGTSEEVRSFWDKLKDFYSMFDSEPTPLFLKGFLSAAKSQLAELNQPRVNTFNPISEDDKKRLLEHFSEPDDKASQRDYKEEERLRQEAHKSACEGAIELFSKPSSEK